MFIASFIKGNVLTNFISRGVSLFTMGQTLSEPVTTKHTATHANRFVRVASSSMQGWRISMEDAHTSVISGSSISSTSPYPSSTSSPSSPGMPLSPVVGSSYSAAATASGGFGSSLSSGGFSDPQEAFFGVYDGHGGSAVAHHVGAFLHKKLTSLPAYGRGDIEVALKQTFLVLDHEMSVDSKLKEEMSGTTAVCVVVKNNKIYCANAGDSRAIASKNGLVQNLSFDHKPNNEGEMKRIVAAGGFVEFNRVNGNLALSRALGDFMFKKNDRKTAEEQIVTACPEIVVKDLQEGYEFLLLACDGIWDVMSNNEVLSFVRSRIAQQMEPTLICEDLINTCLAPDNQMGGLGCDNMTVILVCVLRGGTYEQLAARCSRHSAAPVL